MNTNINTRKTQLILWKGDDCMKFNGKIGYTLVILFGALGMYVQTKMQEQQIKEQVNEYMDTHKNELTQ